MPRPHPPEFRAEAIRLARDLCAEISRTTFSSNPRRVRKTEVTWSSEAILALTDIGRGELLLGQLCRGHRTPFSAPRMSASVVRDDLAVVGGGSASYLGASIEMRGHAAGIP